jgi:hypothetical protein
MEEKRLTKEQEEAKRLADAKKAPAAPAAETPEKTVADPLIKR